MNGIIGTSNLTKVAPAMLVTSGSVVKPVRRSDMFILTHRKTGIYIITNKANGKKYIGQSVDILQRLRGHRYDLKHNIHGNSHLQNAYNKYGEENFSFEVFLTCSQRELNEMERRLIFEHKTTNPEYGYNVRIGGDFEGHSDEVRRKIAETLRGRTFSEERRKNISEAHKGIPSGKKGKKASEDSRRKMSDAHKGKPSPRKGATLSEKIKKKISDALKGKMSEASKRGWEKRRG